MAYFSPDYQNYHNFYNKVQCFHFLYNFNAKKFANINKIFLRIK